MNINDIFAAAALEIANEFEGLSNTTELKDCVRDILPLVDAEISSIAVKGTLAKFKAEITCTMSLSIAEFINTYNQNTNETLKIAATKTLSSKSVYNVWNTFRCHHNTRYPYTKKPCEIVQEKPSKRFKNTNCPFNMVIKLLKVGEFPYLITLEWHHNHPVSSFQAWSYKDIPLEILENIKELYAKGFTPAHAFRLFMCNLREKCQNDYVFHLQKADRSKCPRRGDFYNIYTHYCKELYGAKNGELMFSALEEKISSIKENNPDIIIKSQTYDETIKQPFILTIVTPFMKRVHAMVR